MLQSKNNVLDTNCHRNRLTPTKISKETNDYISYRYINWLTSSHFNIETTLDSVNLDVHFLTGYRSIWMPSIGQGIGQFGFSSLEGYWSIWISTIGHGICEWLKTYLCWTVSRSVNFNIFIYSQYSNSLLLLETVLIKVDIIW